MATRLEPYWSTTASPQTLPSRLERLRGWLGLEPDDARGVAFVPEPPSPVLPLLHGLDSSRGIRWGAHGVAVVAHGWEEAAALAPLVFESWPESLTLLVVDLANVESLSSLIEAQMARDLSQAGGGGGAPDPLRFDWGDRVMAP